MRAKKNELDTMKTRTVPKVLCELISSLNPTQIDVVVEMGFGTLLNWDIKELPPHLSYWVIDNFHPNSCSIRISKEKEIHIREIDVYYYTGLPKGNTQIECKKRHLSDPWVKAFMQQFDIVDEETNEMKKLEPKNVTPKMLANKILECDVRDVWFKRNFVILFSNQVVECCTSGGINLTLLDILEDTSVIKHLDWCTYMRKILIEASDFWLNKKRSEKASKTVFKGPIMLPMVST